MSVTERLEEKNQPASTNYSTVEVKTEEEIEKERREYVERVDMENQAKAINAKANRNKADRIFFKATIAIFVIMFGILFVRWLMMT